MHIRFSLTLILGSFWVVLKSPRFFFCLFLNFFLIFKFLKFNLQPSARLILHVFSILFWETNGFVKRWIEEGRVNSFLGKGCGDNGGAGE